MWQGKSRGGFCGFNLADIAIPWTRRWVRGKFRLDRPGELRMIAFFVYGTAGDVFAWAGIVVFTRIIALGDGMGDWMIKS